VFTPVLAKYSKNFNLIHWLEIGGTDMQRNFEPVEEPSPSLAPTRSSSTGGV